MKDLTYKLILPVYNKENLWNIALADLPQRRIIRLQAVFKTVNAFRKQSKLYFLCDSVLSLTVDTVSIL